MGRLTKGDTPLFGGSLLGQATRLQVGWGARVVVLIALLLSLLQIAWVTIQANPRHTSTHLSGVDPGYGWQDDIWPIRPQKAWDISTDYSHHRSLKYDVEEGTWLRLDVSPDGDVVFDMVGDIYCLPASSLESLDTSRALPVLTGIPHDSDPHFSPDGKMLVFRSDAGLGVENIWVMPWLGCSQSAVKEYHDTPMALSPELRRALEHKEKDLELLKAGVRENSLRRERRLLREGRADARMVTNETYRWVSDARFHPSGNKIIATKWYTSGRSLGAGEGWEYEIPALSNSSALRSGDGVRLVGRNLPFGWTPEQYPDQQIGPEQFIWWGADRLIYSMNVVEASGGVYEYSKDVYAGIYAIFARNLTTGITETLVSSSPGGASRPELSRDGKTLAFVRRVRDKEALVLQDLKSGTIHHAWYGLTYDLSSISAPMGTYPSFAFTPGDDAIIIWAAGGLWKVPLVVDSRGQRVADNTQPPRKIKWKATIEKQLADTRYTETDLVGEDTKEVQQLHSFKDLSVDDQGKVVVFQGAGVNYYLKLNGSAPASPLPILHPSFTYYSPSLVPHLNHLVVHARWSDTSFSSLELADLNANKAYELGSNELAFGRYTDPVLCECEGSRRRIAFVRMGGDDMTGKVVATADAGVYLGTITLPGSSGSSDNSSYIEIRDIHKVSPATPARLRFTEGAKKLIMHDDQSATIVDLSAGPDNFGNYRSKVVAEGRMSQELSITPTAPRASSAHFANIFSGPPSSKPAYAAFVDFFQVYLADAAQIGSAPVWSKPGPNATEGLARVSLDGGHDLAWSNDGSRLFWLLGPYLHSLEISKLERCADEIKADTSTFGIQCIKNLLEVHKIGVFYDTDVSRIKKEARAAFHASRDHQDRGALVEKELRANAGILVIANATLVTMETGDEGLDVIYGGNLVIRGGLIQEVITTAQLKHWSFPPGAKIINAEGGIVVPGFVDVHAHWNGDYTVASSWEHRTFLAYGCTTVHNPSLDNVDAWAERGRVERGMMVGPRIFTTGTIIYGAGEAQYHQDIADEDEARSALIRIKVEGGPYSFSYKNYNLPSRASRQRLITEAKSLGMLVVPEGGMNWDWDLTYIMDGMTTVEHSLPVPVLYDDVLTLFAKSGTGNTPTHIVNYGGAFGEQYVWAHHAIPFDEKLRRFVPHESLEAITQSTSRPMDAYQLFNTSASVYEMTKRGLNANIGAHGEPPLGLNYHAEMFFFHRGGMTPYETLRSATRSGALSLGLFKSIGSLSVGKLADLVIYPPGANVLDDILLSRDLLYTVKGGRVWHAATMVEEWPVKGRTQTMPPFNAD